MWCIRPRHVVPILAVAAALLIVFGVNFVPIFTPNKLDNLTSNTTTNAIPHSKPTGQTRRSFALNLTELMEIGSYVHPLYPSIVGRKFDLTEKARNTAKELIRELGASFIRKPVQMDSTQSLPKVTPVTAISSDHFEELLNHLGSVEKVYPQTKIVVYDLGLSKEQVDKLQYMVSVEYRKFDFSRFPEHVRDLHTYAFKPLIIQQTLAQFNAVLWHDSSIVLKEDYTERMVKHKSGFLHYAGGTGHSIVAATHPKMLEYLRMKGMEEMGEPMEQGGALLVFNTEIVLKNIIKWAIVCSLHKECIAPSGAQLYGCNFSGGKYKYGGCHRYDQSMFSILSSNAYNYQRERYTLMKNETPAEGVCSGIVRGCGRQKIGMLINFISFFCVGLPLGITLTFFVFHDIFGLWIGVFCAGVLQSFLYITLLWRTNWEQQAKLAQERTSTKAVLEFNSDGLTNGDCHTREEPGYGKVTDPVIASWIYKSSSLLFLNRVKNDESQARHSLLSGSVDEHGGERHHPEDNGEREHAAKAALMKPSSRLTPSEKRSLVIQRLIPLVICLAILGAAVAIRFLIPLPSSSEVDKVANVTTSSNTTANFTSGF